MEAAACRPQCLNDGAARFRAAVRSHVRLVHSRTRASHPAVANWAKTTRLNPLNGIALCRDDPTVKKAHELISRFGAAAAENLDKLLRSGIAEPPAVMDAH